jgi:hypothetical protein
MGNRTLISSLLPLLVAAVVAAGCNGSDAIPKHGVDDQKAIDQYKAMTPQQRIDMIQKGPMPQAAKDHMIKQIKDENHL